MDPAFAFNIAPAAVGGAIVALALMLMLGGAIGVLRFPDVYTRLHAAGVGDGLGAVLFVLGLAALAPDGAIALRLILLAALLAALGPVWAILGGGAAHAGGVSPLTGRYTAPRPGTSQRQDLAR